MAFLANVSKKTFTLNNLNSVNTLIYVPKATFLEFFL